ncbi:MAG: hypothetical protein ACLQVD_07060 [Capsulimonadaceae bacterium]
MTRYIKIAEIGDGIFPTEYSVSVESLGKKYGLIVDRSFVRDGMLEVQEVSQSSEGLLIQLPAETFNDGTRIYVSPDDLVSCDESVLAR